MENTIMRRNLFPLLIMITWICPIAIFAKAHGTEPSITLKSFVVETIDSAARTARITFSGRMDVAGNVDLILRLPDNGGGAGDLLSSTWRGPEMKRQGDEVVASWDVVLPRDGYIRLIDLDAAIAVPDTNGHTKSTGSALFCLYADIVNGVVRSYGPLPDPHRVHKSPSVLLPGQYSRHDRALASAVPVTINVHISGRIACKPFDQSSLVRKGVPAVMVYIDWDADDNYATYQHPAYADGAVEWAVTDDEGYYQFNRQVIVEPDDPIWNVHLIRMTAQAANPGGQDEELGQEAIFAGYDFHQISISPTSPDISLSLSMLDADPRYGNTLRYLMRARAFCFQTFGHLPDPIDFEVDQPGSTFWSDPTGIFSPTIEVAQSNTGPFDIYHEYGHYVEYLYGDNSPMSECDGGHYWDVRTTTSAPSPRGGPTSLPPPRSTITTSGRCPRNGKMTVKEMHLSKPDFNSPMPGRDPYPTTMVMSRVGLPASSTTSGTISASALQDFRGTTKISAIPSATMPRSSSTR
jgi:hypothetical protein